jgi:hypothetical protein
VVGYSLDEARQHFLGQRFQLWTHVKYPAARHPSLPWVQYHIGSAEALPHHATADHLGG